jgi:hypothetical protein
LPAPGWTIEIGFVVRSLWTEFLRSRALKPISRPLPSPLTWREAELWFTSQAEPGDKLNWAIFMQPWTGTRRLCKTAT